MTHSIRMLTGDVKSEHIYNPGCSAPLPRLRRFVPQPQADWLRRPVWLVLIAASLLAGCGGGDPIADQAAAVCRSQVNDRPDKLLNCVTLEGVGAHLLALSAVAQVNGGNRSIDTPGFAASQAYVQQALIGAGYRVTLQPFSYRTFKSLAPAQLAQTMPFAQAIDSRVFGFSGSGSVTAQLSKPVAGTGCAVTDFAGFKSGHIALLQRGGCSYMQKADLAVKAGAVGAVIYNNQAGGVLEGDVSAAFLPEVPVVGVSQAAGEQLAERINSGLTLALTTRTARPSTISHNLLAELTGQIPDHLTLLGAHLDSVPVTAGMNDNGSGVAALLETALQMAKVSPINTLRFAFWGGEEVGLLGSNHYVVSLSAAEQQQIDLYLNFDMIASPNPVYLYGADNGQTRAGGLARLDSTRVIEDVMTAVYRQRGVPFKRELLPGASDHEAFDKAGIPFGWIFTGADEIKSREEVAVWGGTANVQMDPCYHETCDNLANVNAAALELNADAIAYAALYFAMNRLPR